MSVVCTSDSEALNKFSESKVGLKTTPNSQNFIQHNPKFLRDQETSPVISSSRSRSGSSSRLRKIPIKEVVNPFLLELDDGEDEHLVNAADFLDQSSQGQDEGSVFKKVREGSSKGEKEKGSERFSLVNTAQEGTLGGLTESDFGTDDLFCVLNSQKNNQEFGREVPEEALKQKKQEQKNERQGEDGGDDETNQKLRWNAVDDEEDMFASTPETDNKNDNNQHDQQSKNGNIESNWGSDALSGLGKVGSGAELVKNTKGGNTSRVVSEVSNIGNTPDGAKKRGQAHIDGLISMSKSGAFNGSEFNFSPKTSVGLDLIRKKQQGEWWSKSFADGHNLENVVSGAALVNRNPPPIFKEMCMSMHTRFMQENNVGVQLKRVEVWLKRVQVRQKFGQNSALKLTHSA